MQWAKELHLNHISLHSLTPASESEITLTSSATMTTLAPTIAAIINHSRVRDSILIKSSESKSYKFKSWPENKKTMLLHSMTIDGKALIVTPPTEFLIMGNQKSMNRFKEEIEALLSLDDCIFDIFLTLAATL